MEATFPRLRDEAVIRRFDAGERGPTFIVQIDGRHYVVTPWVAALLELTRHARTYGALARGMSQRFGTPFTSSELDSVLSSRMPAVFFRAESEARERGPLPWRVRVLSAAALAPLLSVGSRLLGKRLALALASIFLTLDVLVGLKIWHDGLASVAQGSLVVACLLVLAGVFVHELGHLSACHRFGATHGGIGIGLYWYLPVLYSEVHGAWMLPRVERAIVDVAGIYFQCVFLAFIAALWLAHPSGTLLIVLWSSHLLVLNTLNPVLKYDGYWLLSDLSGRYNLHRHVRDTARQYWLALRGWPQSPRPSLKDRRLLVFFVVLAGAYFAYLLHFLAHSLAYSASRIEAGQPTPRYAVAVAGFTLMLTVTLGVSAMLARALYHVASTRRRAAAGAGA
jgi:putative peptide zinc metalloprotease protein